jgi:pimeloyl-ACP methyl ester carboxylesterase
MYASMLSQFPVIEDRLEQLTSISVPTLVQVGDLDTPFVGASERMAATIPGAALDRFSDACHMPQFEARADWERSLHRFLGDPFGEPVGEAVVRRWLGSERWSRRKRTHRE